VISDKFGVLEARMVSIYVHMKISYVPKKSQVHTVIFYCCKTSAKLIAILVIVFTLIYVIF